MDRSMEGIWPARPLDGIGPWTLDHPLDRVAAATKRLRPGIVFAGIERLSLRVHWHELIDFPSSGVKSKASLFEPAEGSVS